jgi:hypothetical protein
MKQEKLCETEDMTDKDYSRWYMDPTKEIEYQEELGAENERVRRQLRDAEILASYPGGLQMTPELKEEVKKMTGGEWKDVPEKPRIKAANTTQVGGDHYKRMDIQPWDVIDHGPRQQAIGFYRYNSLKYIMRAGEKGDFKEDIQKAHHYLQKLLELL